MHSLLLGQHFCCQNPVSNYTIGMIHIGAKKKCYLLKKGIMQGDPLSPFLSDIYYGSMVENEMGEFMTSSSASTQELFLRGADDFIFVSTDKVRVLSLFNFIKDGVKNYNCKFKLSKTNTNAIGNLENNMLLFCGALINVSSREICPNYSSYKNTKLLWSQSWERRTRPGDFIHKRFIAFCSSRLNKLYFGPYNSKKTLLTTICCNVLLALRRLTCLITTLIWSKGRMVDNRWFWRITMSGLRKFCNSTQNYGLSALNVQYICLKCVELELKRSDQYSKILRKYSAKKVAKFCLSSRKQEYLNRIIREACSIIEVQSIKI